jgi:hypothetical protein
VFPVKTVTCNKLLRELSRKAEEDLIFKYCKNKLPEGSSEKENNNLKNYLISKDFLNIYVPSLPCSKIQFCSLKLQGPYF